MKHLGDITKINGSQIEPVSVITFGSPCTRLSVAGRHDGFNITFQCCGKKTTPHFTHTIKDRYKKPVPVDYVCLGYESETDKTFRLVVFDPPHLIRVSDQAYMRVKYGRLDSTWQDDLRAGFDECMRVLDDYGTLIFKWSEVQIPTSKVIDAIGRKPLFGHISGRKSNTHWMTFMRFPSREE